MGVDLWPLPLPLPLPEEDMWELAPVVVVVVVVVVSLDVASLRAEEDPRLTLLPLPTSPLASEEE